MRGLPNSVNIAPTKHSGLLGGWRETLWSASATADAEPPLVRSLRYPDVARVNRTRQSQSWSADLWVPEVPGSDSRCGRYQPWDSVKPTLFHPLNGWEWWHTRHSMPAR